MSLRSVLSRRLDEAQRPVGQTPSDVVARDGHVRLLRYREGARPRRFKTPVLLVPSLINRHYVLDLLPQRSLIEFLVQAGHDVFLIDWGEPPAEARFLDLDAIAGRIISRALREARRLSGADSVHLLGYCMGGTLTAIHAAAFPEGIASLTALAAPVAFDDAGLLGRFTRTRSFDVHSLVAAFGNVPWPLLQLSFHMLRPTLSLAKGAHLLDRFWEDASLDGFFALERWSNDNVALPGAFYIDYIERLYRGDELMRGTLTLEGRPVRMEALEMPLLVLTFQGDAIVPEACAKPLYERAASADKTLHSLAGGHVGAVVSRAASRGLWPVLSEFWATRDGAVVSTSADARAAHDHVDGRT